MASVSDGATDIPQSHFQIRLAAATTAAVTESRIAHRCLMHCLSSTKFIPGAVFEHPETRNHYFIVRLPSDKAYAVKLRSCIMTQAYALSKVVSNLLRVEHCYY